MGTARCWEGHRDEWDQPLVRVVLGGGAMPGVDPSWQQQAAARYWGVFLGSTTS